MSRIFEVVQSMSGQGNSITIPCPYLDHFAGDQQAHLLAAILNQLVFWSGKSSQDGGWFYKSHEELAREIRAVTKDQVRKAIAKLISQYFPEIIETSTRKINGSPVKHYRVNGEALISQIFPPALETAVLPNGNGNIATSKRQNRRMETAEPPFPGNGNTATSYLYPDLKTDPDIQILKSFLSGNSDESPNEENLADFKSRHPDAEVFTPSGKSWGTKQDLECAEWIWKKILKLYEDAAETDGEVVRPKDPNWAEWANEIRLMCSRDSRTHRQICELFGRVNRDSFWCRNILSPSKLREKWDELALKLSSSGGGRSFGRVSPVQTTIPPGFRGNK